jgi:Na+-translocating ferredoxin:NAD+ oxidoreductase RnfE subunit
MGRLEAFASINTRNVHSCLRNDSVMAYLTMIGAIRELLLKGSLLNFKIIDLDKVGLINTDTSFIFGWYESII